MTIRKYLDGLFLESSVADGAGTSIAFHFDTVNTITDNGNNLFQIDNNGTKEFSITAGGAIFAEGEFFTTPGLFRSFVADGVGANAFILQNYYAYSTDGANLLQLKNENTPVMSFSYQGGIDHVNSGASTSAHSQSLNLNWLADTTKTSSGQYSTVIGVHCQATATGGFCQGNYSTVAGSYSVAMGNGVYAEASASVALGQHSRTNNPATIGLGGGQFSAGGDAQVMTSCLKIATTDATQTTMQAVGLNYVIPTDTSWAFSALIIARSDEADGNQTASWELKGLIRRDESGNTGIVGDVSKFIIAAMANAEGWGVTAEADDTFEALAIKVTGEAATNIRWVCKLDISQVGYA